MFGVLRAALDRLSLEASLKRCRQLCFWVSDSRNQILHLELHPLVRSRPARREYEVPSKNNDNQESIVQYLPMPRWETFCGRINREEKKTEHRLRQL